MHALARPSCLAVVRWEVVEPVVHTGGYRLVAVAVLVELEWRRAQAAVVRLGKDEQPEEEV